ncbi:MAG: M56 family metallopeptidase [Vicinamibacterales bacterium]
MAWLGLVLLAVTLPLAATAGNSPLPTGVTAAWLAGLALAVIRLARSLRGVRALVQHARPAPAPWQQEVELLARQLGVRGRVRLLVSAQVDVPCSLGLRAGAIVLPATLCERLTRDACRAVAAHELGHVQRRDYAWNLALRTIGAVLWFHPAAWWLASVIRAERERACDAVAASVCPPIDVARGLAHAERCRESGAPQTPRSTHMPLLDRVRVLLQEPRRVTAGAERPLAGLLSGAGVLVTVGALALVHSGTGAAWAGSWLTAGALGLVIGVRHALEPDHLMAVATMVSRERQSGGWALLGAAWGVGHMLTLIAVGSLLVLAHAAMPARVEAALEVAAAVMVTALGARAVLAAWREGGTGPSRVHAHGACVHAHPAGGDHVHVGPWTFARRPLLVGVVHGLAGSGALTALAAASLPTLPGQLGFLVVFGFASALSMAAIAGAAGRPLVRLAHSARGQAALSAATGLAAVAFGMAWGLPMVVRLVS